MNILRFELRRNLKSFLIWTLAIVTFVIWMLSIYQSSFAGEKKGMEELVQLLPESMQKAFGMDRLDLTKITGYFGTEVHLMIILFGSMYSVLLSTNVLSKEESDKTVEFLLSRPITRTEVVTQKLLAYVTYVTLFSGITWLATYWTMLRYERAGFDARAFWLLGGMTFLAALAMASAGFLGSVFVTRNRTVYSAALGLVLVLYAMQLIADVSKKADFLKYFTPFKWAFAGDILPKGRVEPIYLGLSFAVIVLSIAGSYVAYARKDISV